MEREFGTVASIKALGYGSNLCMTRCECDELPCPLLSWLVLELRKRCPEIGGESVTILAGELKDILKAMSYPYDTLGTETLTAANLKKITEFLVSELQAACMLKYKECNPEDPEPQSKSCKEQRPIQSHQDTKNETQVDDKEMIKELSELFQALDMDSSAQLSDVYSQVESRLKSLPEGKVQEPLLKTNLNSTQWSTLDQINQVLCKDYECRRQMMLKRLHVTLQSFAWGERGKERSALMSSIPPVTSPLKSTVSFALLLAAREDQSCILPVTAGSSTHIYKILMGSVPDRGGRPGEIEPPMPIFTRRAEAGDHPKGEKKKFKRRGHSGKKKRNKDR